MCVAERSRGTFDSIATAELRRRSKSTAEDVNAGFFATFPHCLGRSFTMNVKEDCNKRGLRISSGSLSDFSYSNRIVVHREVAVQPMACQNDQVK